MALNFEQIPLFGGGALIVSALPAIFLFTDANTYASPGKTSHLSRNIPPSTEFAVHLSTAFTALCIGAEPNQIAFSIDPPRPSSTEAANKLMVRLSNTKERKSVELPAKLGLEYAMNNSLRFTEQTDQFWIECSIEDSGLITSSIFYRTPEGEAICKANWNTYPLETPIQTSDEFPLGSPFRLLAEARWWGQDLALEKFGELPSFHRLEFGNLTTPEILECTESDWLVFKNNKWLKTENLSGTESFPIAHIKNSNSQALELEGWESSSHVRLKLLHPSAAPLKAKGEELFTQLRIRSEKQVSCVMDKQCLILRVGDWVVKNKEKWKILRKKEDKAAFLAGTMTGELFILEKIDAKGPSKSISGELYSPKRSSSVTIDYSPPPRGAPALKVVQPARPK